MTTLNWAATATLAAPLPPVEQWPSYCASKGTAGFCCLINRCHFICQCQREARCAAGHVSRVWFNEASRECTQLVAEVGASRFCGLTAT